MAAAANSGSNLPLFDCPTWAGKPPPGLHLDVVKGDKLIEKLIIDEKKYYLFGRNPDLCDFTIDHQSCSRVHAALVYHKHLKRVFLIDLNSTHGTFLGHIRLEPHKPQQIPIDSTVSFGASTRAYTLREKPQTLPSAVKGDEKMGGEDDELKGLLGLPEEETELDRMWIPQLVASGTWFRLQWSQSRRSGWRALAPWAWRNQGAGAYRTLHSAEDSTGACPPRTVKPALSRMASMGQHSSVACPCHTRTSPLMWT
uniref:Nuclear inhibitor of protein phosphatase 1 n=1 Tax=Equus asinus TaxID=9793 RepID=A0A8C4LSB5_EQUAS